MPSQAGLEKQRIMNKKVIPLRIGYIFAFAAFLGVISVLQSTFHYVNRSTLLLFDWYFEALQPLITYGLWAVICPVLYRYYPEFALTSGLSFTRKLGVIRNGILIAGLHRLLTMTVLWVCLYLFNEAYVHEAFLDQAVQMFGTGWIESILIFWLIMGILTLYIAYQNQQIELFEMQRELSYGMVGAQDAPWSRIESRYETEQGLPHATPLGGHTLVTGHGNALIHTMGSSPIVLNPRRGMYIDQNVVAPCFYDQFHSLLTDMHRENGLTVGIISPNAGEGKTLVASNLAVSLALGYQKKTVLLDFNVRRPELHHVFDTALSPGLIEAMDESLGNRLHVSATPVKGLFLMTAGGVELGSSEAAQATWSSPKGNGNGIHTGHARPMIGMEQAAAFFEVVNALEREFECVVIDMPPVNTDEFPVLLANRLGNFLAVVNTSSTKQQDIDRMMKHVNEQQIMGFVLNQGEQVA